MRCSLLSSRATLRLLLITTVGSASCGRSDLGLRAAVVGGDDAAVGSTRVTDGQILLYTFTDGDNLVRDVAGVSPPWDLTIADPGAVTWLSGGGLRIDSETRLGPAAPNTRVADVCNAANEVTLEAWIRPIPAGATPGTLPARIAVLAANTDESSLMVGQGTPGVGITDHYEIRVTMSSSDSTVGTRTITPPASATNEMTHLVMTVDATGAHAAYINGAVAATRHVLAGNIILSTPPTFDGTFDLDPSHVFAMANDPGAARPWLGTFYLFAVYRRALTAAEVARNFAAGLP